jgi:hypothetical protein
LWGWLEKAGFLRPSEKDSDGDFCCLRQFVGDLLVGEFFQLFEVIAAVNDAGIDKRGGFGGRLGFL